MSFAPGQGPDFSAIYANAGQTPAAQSNGVPGDLMAELAQIGVTSLAGLTSQQLADIAQRLNDHRNARAQQNAQNGQSNGQPAAGQPPTAQYDPTASIPRSANPQLPADPNPATGLPGYSWNRTGNFNTVAIRNGSQDGSREAALTQAELDAIQNGIPGANFLDQANGLERQYAGSDQYMNMLYDRLKELTNAAGQTTSGGGPLAHDPGLAQAITETERELYRVWLTGGIGQPGHALDFVQQTPDQIGQPGTFQQFLQGQGVYVANQDPAVRAALERANPAARDQTPEPTAADVAKLQGYITALKSKPSLTPDEQSHLQIYTQRLGEYQARVAAAAAAPKAPAITGPAASTTLRPAADPATIATLQGYIKNLQGVQNPILEQRNELAQYQQRLADLQAQGSYANPVPGAQAAPGSTAAAAPAVDYGAAAAKNLEYIQNLQKAAQSGPLTAAQLDSLAAATAKYSSYSQQAQAPVLAPIQQPTASTQPISTAAAPAGYSSPTQAYSQPAAAPAQSAISVPAQVIARPPTSAPAPAAVQPITQPAAAPVSQATMDKLAGYVSNLQAVKNPTAAQSAELQTYLQRQQTYAARGVA